MNNVQVKDLANVAPVAVIFRRDAAGNPVGFLKDTLNMSDGECGTIGVWHREGGKNVRTVPMSYYDATTKLSDAEELEMANKFAEGYRPKFGIAVKRRVAKDKSEHSTHPAKAANTSRRSTDTPVEQAPAVEASTPAFDKKEFVEKLIVSFANALRDAIKE